MALLKALFLPKRLSIISCPGHQRGETEIIKGNRLAEETAKQAALGPQLLTVTVLTEQEGLKRDMDSIDYTDEDLNTVQKLGAELLGID